MHNKKCFICNKEYNPKKIIPIKINNNGKLEQISQVRLKGQSIPLCNKCFRSVAVSQLVSLAGFHNIKIVLD